MKSFVTLSDIHYPYHDEAAMELVLKFLKDFQPDELYLNGDIWDMPQISKYNRRKEEWADRRTLQEHIDIGNKGVAEIIDAAGARKNYVIMGNHEDRWNSYLGSAAKELASLRALDMENLFNLSAVNWCRYGEGFWVNDNLFIYHGTATSQAWTEREQKSVGASTITGHMHRQRVTYHTDRKSTYKSIGQGCLCMMNPPYHRTPPDWQQGFAFGYTWDDHKFRAIESEIITGEDGKWTAPEGQLYVSTLGSPRRSTRQRKPRPKS